MITLISGTNRKESITEKFSRIYFSLLLKSAPDSKFFDLTALPPSILAMDPDFSRNRPAEVIELQDNFFTAADKFVFIIPEYNGSFPGILKLLIDVMDPRIAFKGKKAALVGIATGRAGNLRGMDHLTAILHHMGALVLPYQLPVSRIQDELNDGQLSENTIKVVNRHIDELLRF